jgi:CRP-like cAMP-binding protein
LGICQPYFAWIIDSLLHVGATMTELEAYILHYCQLDEPELATITRKFRNRLCYKEEYLLTPGQVCKELLYLVKGNCRIFYLDRQGKEITTWIAFQDTHTTELASFLTQQPTQFYVQALTDCQLAAITYQDLEQLYRSLPKFGEFGRKIAEEVVVGAINRVVSFQLESAQQRYQRLLKRSEYLNQIPLKHLASFLGITDTSLSRLRKKKN